MHKVTQEVTLALAPRIPHACHLTHMGTSGTEEGFQEGEHPGEGVVQQVPWSGKAGQFCASQCVNTVAARVGNKLRPILRSILHRSEP